jgi:glycosyltransferase involved in cell wall biosynthesis
MKKDNRYIVINKFLSDEEVANLTRYASCVVCPYVSGSQSGITHTAMVYGTPVIATKVGAFPEFVEEGKNGDLIDYGDKEGLTRSIEKYINNEGVKQYYVPNKLRWDMIVNTLERMLSTINKDI